MFHGSPLFYVCIRFCFRAEFLFFLQFIFILFLFFECTINIMFLICSISSVIFKKADNPFFSEMSLKKLQFAKKKCSTYNVTFFRSLWSIVMFPGTELEASN